MTRLKPLLLALAISLTAGVVMADVSDLPTKTINGKLYHYYTVEPKETLYSLQHKLGVDRATIERYNPSVVDGLQAHQTLYFPATAATTRKVAQAIAATPANPVHTVAKGESVYGIARAYDVTVDDLMAANPAARDGIKPGMNLTIPVNGVGEAATAMAAETAQTAEPVARLRGIPYTIKNGETLYAIAKAHGVTTDEILDVNPGMSPTFYRGGQTIIIPIAEVDSSEEISDDEVEIQIGYVDTEVVDEPDESETEEPVVIYRAPAAADEAEEEAEETLPAPVAPVRSESSIAVMLPFMLGEKTVSKQAARYTEFYKGLLLAADTLKSVSRPVRIYAYDTAGSIDTLRAILKRPELKNVQAIIAPPDEAQLRIVGAFGRDNGVMVVNPFAVKDESYLTNPAMIQASVPSATLQRKAVEGLVRRFGNRVPVILRRNGGPMEHADFINSAKEAYLDADITPLIITYTDKLTPQNLARLTAGSSDYLFIPTEGKLSEANRFMPALVEYRESLDDPSRVMVMGYPEWITFRNEARQSMAKANTIIYSRFFSDDDSYGARKANDQFAYWYGSAPEPAEPKQGFLGLDLGMYLIKALRQNGGDFETDSPQWDGVQNGFRLVRGEPQAGWSNDVIYFINYRPSGLIDRIEM